MTPARTNLVTIQQVLALWNNAFVLRNSEHLATRIQRQASSADEQIELAIELALSRPATEAEQRMFGDYAARHGLANMCRLLFNSNEFTFID